MNRLALTVAFAAVYLGPASAQETVSAATDSPVTDTVDATPSTEPSVKPAKAKKPKKPANPWSFHTSLSHLSDSNLDQDRNGLGSHGLIVGLGAEYQVKLPKGALELSYTVADHSYTNTDTWDRTTHDFEAAYEHRLSRRWNTETSAEVALKDSSDDGDIRDEYTLQQRLEYRLSPVQRIRLEGGLRKKDYQDDDQRDADAPYYGIGLDQRWSGGRRWFVGYRREENNADDPRRTYRRSTYSTLLARNLTSRDSVSLEAKYRLQRYTERLVLSGGEAVLRRDRRWQVEAAWAHALRKGLELRLDYIFENRRSNDSRREFDDHLFGGTITHRW